VDIDECDANLDDCISSMACINTRGSFSCRCPTGQIGDARVGGAGCLDVPGLVLWLDGSDPFDDQSPPQSGRAIGTWVDRSGNGNHASQGAASRRPVYVQGGAGKGVIRFDGLTVPNGDELDIDNSGGEFDLNDATVFVVLARRFAANPSNPGFFSVRAGNFTRISMHLHYQGAGWMIWNGSTLTYTAEAPSTPGQLQLLEASWDLGTETRRTNGAVLESIVHQWNALEVFRTLHIGWSGNPDEHLNADIAEIIVLNHALVPADRDWIADYVGDKWGVALP